MIELKRETKETNIQLSLNPYGTGKADIHTGVGFFDHMLTAFAVHGQLDLSIHVKGDLEVDCHHTIEDTGIVLGKAFAQAFQDKRGIARFGSAYIPMDEALCFTAVDFSGRPFLVYENTPSAPMIGTYDTQMTQEFFRALAYNALITLHVRCLYGDNEHHKVEGMFKATGRAMRMAMAKTGSNEVLSSKGVLE